MRAIDADILYKSKFHPLPYTQITPPGVDTESYKRGWNDAIDAIIESAPTIESEPCDDAVSRRILLNDLKELIVAWGKYPVMAEQIKGVEVAIRYVETIPSVTPKRKTGKWIIESLADDFAFVYSLKCSECGEYYDWEHNFCPNCGAKMDGNE